MTTALFDKIITLPAITGAQSPVDTLESRVAISNVARLADQSAQVVAAWVHDSVLLQPPLNAGYSLIWSSDAMVSRRRDDGKPYRLRVGLRGFRSGGSGTIEFVIMVVPGEALGGGAWINLIRQVDEGRVSADMVARATISATSAAWITLSRTWIQEQPLARFGVGGTGVGGTGGGSPTLRELGGDVVTASTPTTAVAVIARQITGSGSSAALTGVYAAEYAGPP